MTRFILIGLLFILSLDLAGQEDYVLGINGNTLSWFNSVPNTDSLKKLLKAAEGPEKVYILCELSNSMNRAKVPGKEYKPWLMEAMELSEELDYNHGRVMTHFLLADYFIKEKNDTLQSLKLLRKAETFFDDHTHWTLKSRVWTSARQAMIRINQMDSAVFYSRKPLEFLDKEVSWFAHLEAHQFLMRQAILNNDVTQKKEHFESVLSILNANVDYLGLSCLNLPSIYENLSIILANDGEYKRALDIVLDLLNNLDGLDAKSLKTEFYIAKILGRAARIYSHWGRYDSALVYIDESFRYFDQIYKDYETEINDPGIYPSFRLWSINAVNQLEERAAILIRTGELKLAREDLLKSIQVRKEHNDLLGVAMCYEKIGEIYAIQGKFIEALNWYNSALEVKSEILESELNRTRRDAIYMLFASESFASTYYKIGTLYKDWGKPHLASEYYWLSLRYSRDGGFQRCEAEALTALGDLFLISNQPDSTLHYYNTANRIYRQMDYLPGMAEIAECMGDFYNHQNYFNESLESYGQSQEMFGQLDMPAGIARLLIKQGNLLMKNQLLDQAIARYEEGLYFAKNVNIPGIKMEAWQNLSDIYFSMSNLEQAFICYKHYQEIKDQLFTLETGRYLAEIEARYETEQNRQELLLLQREKELMQIKETRARLIIIIMVAFIAIMLLWILLYLRHSNLKNGHEKITLQLKMFRSQLNPHFIFNSLGSIQSSILNEEPEKAVKYISRFSKLMRNILDSSDNERIPLSKEIATIKNYLELQKVRFTHKFDYHINVEDHMDTESFLIPPMLAQPFIENAIEHGIKPMEIKGLITISIQQRNDFINIEIEDNGVGRKKAGEILQKQDKDHKSMAIDITRRRIDVINRKSKHPVHFEIEDLYHDNGEARGTRVLFAVPV